MTFKTTVLDPAGQPIQGALVGANDEISGQSFFRSTDGGGYADVAMIGVPVGHRCTLFVMKDGFAQHVDGDAYVTTAEDQILTITLQPSFKRPSRPAPVPRGLPPIPTRDQVCALRTSLQGLTYHTTQYGDIPAWFYAGLNETDRALARKDHQGAGDTHIPISIAAAYIEPTTLWPDALRFGYDYAYDLDAFRAILLDVIRDGLLIDLPLAGDGLSRTAHPQRGEYNDPQGNTYGYEWLMANLARIIAALKGDGTPATPDLTPYIIFRPGWDAVFYGWGRDGEVPDQQPDRVRRFGELFRQLLPNGYLAIEHTPGNIPCGEGGKDYAPGGLMRNFDTILSEFNTVHENSCWQIVARMVPHYNRPPDQPSGDDPHPPFYLAPGTDRGPYFYVAFEPTKGGVYEWCRGRCTLADVNATRDYLRGLGCALVG